MGPVQFSSAAHLTFCRKAPVVVLCERSPHNLRLPPFRNLAFQSRLGCEAVRFSPHRVQGEFCVWTKSAIPIKQAYRSIDALIFVFIAGAIPLGDAMQKC